MSRWRVDQGESPTCICVSPTYRAHSSVGKVAEETKRQKDDALVAVTTGTVIWVAAGLVLLVLRDRIDPGGEWWLWTCVVAVVSGFGGILYLRRRRKRVK